LGLSFADTPSHLFEFVFLGAFIVQRLPVLLLVAVIVLQSLGPTKWSKCYLCLAAVLNIVGDLPENIWANILPGSCIFIVAIWIDFIDTVYLISLLFFFLFIRSEYMRNMEETIWQSVSQIQDTFDFRRF